MALCRVRAKPIYETGTEVSQSGPPRRGLCHGEVRLRASCGLGSCSQFAVQAVPIEQNGRPRRLPWQGASPQRARQIDSDGPGNRTSPGGAVKCARPSQLFVAASSVARYSRNHFVGLQVSEYSARVRCRGVGHQELRSNRGLDSRIARSVLQCNLSVRRNRPSF